MTARSHRILRKDWSWKPEREVRAAIRKGGRKTRDAARKGSEEWSVARRRKREAIRKNAARQIGLREEGLGDNNQFGDSHIEETGTEAAPAPGRFGRLAEGSLTGDLSFVRAETLKFGDRDCESSAEEEADIDSATVSSEDLV